MGTSPLSLKSLHHGRSLSLPSTSYPTTSQYDETLSTLKVSETTSSSLSSLNKRINGLKNLYDNLKDLLILPHIQQIISQQHQDKCVDKVLDSHIRLLDACSTTKDLFSHMKQNVQELLSSLRRKDARGIHCYLNSRKNLKKTIQKVLKDLRCKKEASLEKDDESMTLLCKLKEAESVTFVTLESLLSHMMGTKTKSSRSLISKLIHSKKASQQGEKTELNDFNRVDDFLQKNQEDDTQAENLVNHWKEMDSSIQGLEEELESFIRQLIKTRVLLLNILNY